MGDTRPVTITHSVTGATRTVSVVKAQSLIESGWQYVPLNPRRGAPADDPDVEAGKAQLFAATGEKPEPLHLATTQAKAAKKAEQRHAAGAEAAEAEAEAGHAGLQVDEGASDAS